MPISARDDRSFRELEKVYSGQLIKTLDLSLYKSLNYSNVSRFFDYIVYGDSFYPDVSKKLLSLSSRQEGAVCIPIMTSIKSRKANLIQPLRSFRDAYLKVHRDLHRLRYPSLHFASNAAEYLSSLSNAKLHITGRFHGACLSLLVGTPFLATTSNSWKIESLIKDIGLSEKRILTLEALEKLNIEDKTYLFSDLEILNLEQALTNNRGHVDSAFDQITSIVKSR